MGEGAIDQGSSSGYPCAVESYTSPGMERSILLAACPEVAAMTRTQRVLFWLFAMFLITLGIVLAINLANCVMDFYSEGSSYRG